VSPSARSSRSEHAAIARGGDVLVEPHQSDVGLADAALAHAAAGDERGGVAHLRHQPRAEAVEHAGENEDVGRVDEGAEALGGTCFGSGLGHRNLLTSRRRVRLFFLESVSHHCRLRVYQHRGIMRQNASTTAVD